MSAPLEMFFDGECPLCRREIAMLRRMDRRGRLQFTDIAAPGFDPGPLGVDLATLMGAMHARSPTGELISGVEVFRRAYATLGLGLGPAIAITRIRPVARGLDAAYRWFARHRLSLTGRHHAACTSDRCALPTAAPSTAQ